MISDPLMWVEWIDSHMEDMPWTARDIEPDDTVIVSVGFVLKSGPDWITLYSGTWDDADSNVCAAIHIPRSCIRRMVPIAPPK